MTQYSYKGRDPHGELVSGLLDSNSPAGCARILMGRGITPISIEQAKSVVKSGSVLGGRIRRSHGKPDLDDLIFFCRQMHTLVHSGVPLIQGMAGLVETTRSSVLAKTLGLIIRELEAGYGLSQTFGHHGEIFPPMIIGILQVGESSGRIGEAFLRLSGYLERESDTRNRVKTAIRYPVMVLVAITLALGVINLFVIPAFAKVFAGFNTELPWATQILLATSNFAVHHWPWVLLGLAFSVWLWQRFIRTQAGRLWWDRRKLSLPVIGPIIINSTLGRFARSFAMMMKSGVPIIQSLTILAEALDNAYVAGLIIDLRRSIERGDSISHTAAELEIFPPLMLQMIAVGEESGRLDEMLDAVADYYDREVDFDLKNLSTAIEPILLLVVGGMVLILALGVFLPIWDLGRAAMRR
ncbi:MAG: type II secretion system F family protein [Methylococcaceae bacterium]|nr:type II secretion system F family protein [Methylococcaceae bacterium]